MSSGSTFVMLLELVVARVDGTVRMLARSSDIAVRSIDHDLVD